ncbi:MAG: peptidase domain-containing ABC transporter [Cyclobacteriaceae bacterium]|nr:peptidase domain-containing ABC transporter [Cyclobacteriaceae bacterium]
MPANKIIENTIVRQQDQSACGVACLLSIIKFHGGDQSLEQLRKLSGTSRQGTTLLGLLQAAQQLGFEAEGLEAESVANLSELTEPAILHVVIDNRLQHYIVFYPSEYVPLSSGEGLGVRSVRLHDPARGLITLTPSQLDQIWQSKALLKLIPTPAFEKATAQKQKKKHWIISLIKDDLNILLISLVLGILIAVLGISSAIFSQKLIDDILPTHNYQKLILSLVLVTILLLARSGLGFLRGLFMIRQGVDFNNRIIQSFYNNLLGLPKSFFDTRKTGDLIARMNDTRRIQTVLAVLFGSVSIDLLVVLVSFGFVFAYSVWVGVILLGSLPVYAILLYKFNKPIITAQKEVMGGYAFAESNFIDTMQGVADIKLSNKLSFFERLNSSVYGLFQQKIADLGKIQIRFAVLSEIIGVLFTMGVFGLAAWLVISEQLLLGEMVALLGIAGGVIPSVNRLMVANIQVQEALVAFDRMFEFTSLPKEGIEVDNTSGKEIRQLIMKDLAFRFPGRKQVLKNINLGARQGQIIALLGESGHGKSTLMQLLQKFYEPESGDILVDGMPLNEIETAWWRSQVASVPQEPKIFNGTLLYNIVLSDQPEEMERAIHFCDETGFGKFFAELPQSYLTFVGEEGINLSGGQKQLVVLARALFRNPRLLLLDEATAAMDRITEKFVMSILKKEKGKRITIFVTHRITTARECDAIIILENGKVVEFSTPEILMQSKNFYSESFG